MTLLETLALLTLIATVAHGSIDVMLKVTQYIESKQNAAPSSEGAAEKPFIRANNCATVLAAGRHDRPCG